MKHIPILILAVLLVFTGMAASSNKRETAAATPTVHATDSDALRTLGDQRFHANCGRCHAAPQKFPPRAMATVLRHMRVRAMITDEDMHAILKFMTQ